MKVFQESSAKERLAFWLMIALTLLPLVPGALSH